MKAAIEIYFVPHKGRYRDASRNFYSSSVLEQT